MVPQSARLLVAAALVLPLAAAGAAGPAAGGGRLDVDAALRASQAAVGGEVGDHVLLDPSGRTVHLGDLRGKPLVLSLVYTSCDHVCSVATRYLAGMVEVARDALGPGRFTVATVGFDAGRDTPDRMRSFARAQGVGGSDWLLLSGDVRTLERLTGELGFTYVATPGGYDHLAQVSIIDAQGRVYRQVYGDRFEPPALVEPLKELVFGRPRETGDSALARWIDGVRLLCTIYDPSAGRYRFDYSVFVGAGIGVLCLGGIGVFLVRGWRDSGRREGIPRPAGAAPPGRR